ncbi:MAG: HAD-IA family hydrolase [Bacteriovorax sp.]|nr:HAD-IA family hydrolase [Bacteriovorax sp.]
MKTLNISLFSALLFDLDGTLADTMPLHNQSWIETLKSFDCKMTNEILNEYAGIPNIKTVKLFNQRFGWSLDPELVVKKKEAKVLEKLDFVSPIESTLKIVKHYHGKKPMAIVSGGNRFLVELILQRMMLLEYFSVLVSAESTVRGKPSPDPFLFAARELNVSPANCLVFEDGLPGIKGAQSCGMSVVQVLADFKLQAL